ncbi:MAG: hypothetical protein L3J76_04190 [Candidatus Hydrothermae bacterium]|nr:hypothetical protein [Candidatus Hydrothermae bacterium]
MDRDMEIRLEKIEQRLARMEAQVNTMYSMFNIWGKGVMFPYFLGSTLSIIGIMKLVEWTVQLLKGGIR